MSKVLDNFYTNFVETSGSTVVSTGVANVVEYKPTASLGAAGGGVPVGSIMYRASGSSVPDGFLKANGASVSQSIYTDLYAEIGTTYGTGSFPGGGVTFSLPDLRGEFIRGFDDGKGVDSGRVIGTAQAAGTGTPVSPFTTNTTGNHAHGYQTVNNQAASAFAAAGGGGSAVGSPSTSTAGNHSHTITGGDAETRPRNLAMIALIKY
jgi:phage-related tail fiber protein